MEEINKIIGKNLLILRKNAKLTQIELADLFNYSDKTISKWENGESLPSIEILYDLAQFYHVSLDALASENDILASKEPEKKVDKLFPTKLIITLLAVSAVWLLATVIFVCLKIIYVKNFTMVFLWAIPLSCVVLVIFNSIWGKQQFLFPILTVLIWTTLMCVHLQLIQYNVWIIYILGIPLQVAVILWSALVQKPISNKRKRKKQKEKSSKKNYLTENDAEKESAKNSHTENNEENL